MAKRSAVYVCQQCGTTAPKWAGRCESCGAWNSLAEETPVSSAGPGARARTARRGAKVAFQDLSAGTDEPARLVSGLGEFDRVAGGGLVAGSALLVGGDPGIGKSTLMLQVAAALANRVPVAYVSGEEAIGQIRMRAQRLGLAASPVRLAAATCVEDLLQTLDGPDAPGVLVIDSIQTMYLEALESAPGTVGQVRASAEALIRLAKHRGLIVILIGHVTKDGMIAGPKVLEHMVDTVLYFEGERGHQFRILRSVKNRFGPANEIGVFEMTGSGLEGVDNPSSLLLAERRGDVSGAAVFAGVEGTRPVLVEIQALVAPSPLGTPRRAVVGWDSNRLSMVLAVLDTRCGLSFAGRDVYLNVAGGLRVTEPAADLAVAAALVSAIADEPVPPDAVVFGEIGLSGEVRAVGQTALRLAEAERLGFTTAWLPNERAGRAAKPAAGGLVLERMSFVRDLVRSLGPRRRGRDPDRTSASA